MDNENKTIEKINKKISDDLNKLLKSDLGPIKKRYKVEGYMECLEIINFYSGSKEG